MFIGCCGCHVCRVSKSVFSSLILAVLVNNVTPNKSGLTLYSLTKKIAVRFRPSQPIEHQLTYHTISLIYAVAKWYWKRDETVHAKGGR